MGLVGELEDSVHVVEILGILLNALLLVLVVFTRLFWRLYFLQKVLISSK
jgi:hypothetical protein